MKKTLLFLSGISFCVLLSAQKEEKMNTETGVIVCEHFSISKPLRELAEEHPMTEDRLNELRKENIRESKDRDHRKPQKFKFSAEKDGPVYGNEPLLIQTDMGKNTNKAPIMNFAGQTVTGFRPMDPSGAAGTLYYMQAINSTTYRIYNKSTGATVLSGSVGSLWAPATPNDGDPIIMYDRYADRWFVSQFGSSGNKIYIAISTTNDPTGSYYTYTFTSPQFPDYLKFSIWQDGYYMTSNQGTQKVFAFQRSAMLTGSPTAKVVYTNFTPPTGGGFFCPMPGDSDGNGGLAPAGTPCPIFTYTDNAWGGGVADAIRVYTMTVNWVPATPTGTIALTATLNTSAFDASYDPSWNDVSQPGTTQKLDGIGGIIQYRAQWRNWSTYRTTVLNWPVKISTSQRSIMWAEIRQDASTGVWSIYQQSIYAPDTKTRWMGSIAMADNGGIGLCYARASTTAGDFMGLYYAGRKVCDPLNTLPVTEQLAVAGTGAQTGGVNRTGDYAQTSLDPDGVTFWYTGEYMGGSTGGSAARTRVYSFQLPVCVAVAPVASFSGTPTTVCAGSAVAFTDLSTNSPTNWSWTFPGGTPSVSALQNPVITYSTPGTYNVSLTSSNGAGSSAPVTMTGYITVNAVPAAPTAGSGTPYCTGQTINLTSNTVTGGTYAWTGPASFTSALEDPTRPAATTAMAGTYSVTVTVAGCTSLIGTTTIVVNTTPAATAETNVTACAGTVVAANTFASTPTGATFAWTNSNTAIGLAASGTTSVPSFTATNSGSTSISGTITITPTLSGCTGTPISYTITVNPLPVVTAETNVNVCAGVTVAANTFVSTPAGATFAWTNSNSAIGLASSGTTSVPSFTATNAGSSAITGTITVTPTLAGCAGTPLTYTITVNPTPSVASETNVSACVGTTVSANTFVSTPAGATFAWTNSNTAIGLVSSGTTSTPSFTATNAGSTAITGTITITPTLAGCAGAPVTYTITVNPIPVVTAETNVTACAGATVSANTFVSTPAGATFAWTNSNTAIGLAASGTTSVPSFVATNTGSVAITGTITITPTLAGCPGNPINYTITVNPSPSAAAETNVTACAGTTVSANTFVSTPTGATFDWTNSNTAIGLVASGTTSVPSFTATNTGSSAITSTITVTPTLSGCAGTPITYTITVNPAPVVTAETNVTVCAGATVASNGFASTPAGATFAWTNSDASIGLATSGTGSVPSFTATNSGATPISATITITPTLAGCVGTSSVYTITVNPLPSTPTISQAGLALTSSSATGNQWYLNGTLIAGATAQNYTVTSNGTYTVVVTNGFGCSSAISAPVVITNVGIEDVANPFGLSIYPNPNDGNFNVTFNSLERSDYTLELYNAIGQIVYREALTDFSGTYTKKLSVVEYGKGVYTLTLTNSKNETVKKIIVY